MKESNFEGFALIELFGHTRICGKICEATVAGAAFIRVDVPETENNPGFTRFFNPSAVYSINPITEEMMGALTDRINERPVQAYDWRRLLEKEVAKPSEELSDDDFSGF